jgi:hypothetical protein
MFMFSIKGLFIFIVGLSQLSATSAKQKTTRYAGGRQ